MIRNVLLAPRSAQSNDIHDENRASQGVVASRAQNEPPQEAIADSPALQGGVRP
jgi:hypothetical protein